MELLVFSLESVYSPFLNCWNSSLEGFGPTYANKKADIDNDNDDNDFNIDNSDEMKDIVFVLFLQNYKIIKKL